MRLAVISDLHLGADNSVLVQNNAVTPELRNLITALTGC
jgi:3',5'-cyclic AMP phosphodiesterase CpdA